MCATGSPTSAWACSSRWPRPPARWRARSWPGCCPRRGARRRLRAGPPVRRLDDAPDPRGRAAAGAAAARSRRACGCTAHFTTRRSGGSVEYQVTRVPQGFGMMWLAGMLSGLLGHRRGRLQGARDGPRHAGAAQGLDHDQQLHDRRDRGGERGRLLLPRRHQPLRRRAGRPRGAARHRRWARGCSCGCAGRRSARCSWWC